MVKEILGLIKKYEDVLVIVEGKNDKKALTELGFKKVITLNKALYQIIESINEKRVVILTDLDKKGKELYSRLAKDLQMRGVVVDNNLRGLLFKTDLRQIEGLGSYLEKFNQNGF